MIKNISQLLRMSLIAFIVVISSAYGSSTVHVFFAGGQSNAVDTWFDGLNNTLSNHYNNYILVTQRHSGNWLYQWYDNGPQDNYRTDFYNSSGTGTLQLAFGNILTNGDTYQLNGFFWFQGEGDTGSATHVGQYNTRFHSMLNQIQTDLNLKPFGYMLAVIDANRSLISLEQSVLVDVLRQIQIEIGNDPLGQSFDTAGYNRVDAWHVDWNSARQLGNDMALAYINKDTDKDGVMNGDDAFPNNPGETLDSDNDGVGDSADVFPFNYAASEDADNDGFADKWNTNCDLACQSSSGLTLDVSLEDTDNDGVINSNDTFPNNFDEYTDTDSDGIGDNDDNCLVDANADQLDTDADNVGNVCDPDDDNDGMSDNFERLYGLNTLNGSDADGDLDGDGKTNLDEFNANTSPKFVETVTQVVQGDDNNGVGSNNIWMLINLLLWMAVMRNLDRYIRFLV